MRDINAFVQLSGTSIKSVGITAQRKVLIGARCKARINGETLTIVQLFRIYSEYLYITSIMGTSAPLELFGVLFRRKDICLINTDKTCGVNIRNFFASPSFISYLC
jgi:hypothetical protein